MKKKFRTSLFVFRRDLRLEDNTGLIFALTSSEKVIPAFIFTPDQIEKNPYRSDHCLQFMIESLQDLESQLKKSGGKLYFFHGKPEEIIFKCISELKIDAIMLNRDYTPYSRNRDQKIEKVCQAQSVLFFSFDDALLHPPEKTLKKNGKPYSLFTPYFRNASKQKVLSPAQNYETNYFSGSIPFAEDKSVLLKIAPKKKIKNVLLGGRTAGLTILKKLSFLSKYETLRDFPAKDYSTHLSPYLKFTVFSPREVYAAIFQKFHSQHELIRALYWRDFFTSVAFFYPHVFKGAFHSKFDQLEWSYNRKSFAQWCNGLTGIPIVDAGMREMNATGFMHNRVRMIVASFLIKDLHIDWRWGEKYFAQTLIDYDPAVNNGNWQWVAGTGCDAQPYFRIFNPWTQQKKFDPDCTYIKKWIPELWQISPKIIHRWYERNRNTQPTTYPTPMIDHKKAASEALTIYRKIETGKNNIRKNL